MLTGRPSGLVGLRSLPVLSPHPVAYANCIVCEADAPLPLPLKTLGACSCRRPHERWQSGLGGVVREGCGRW